MATLTTPASSVPAWARPQGNHKSLIGPVIADVFDNEPEYRRYGDSVTEDGLRDFIFASPVGAANRIYVTGRDGATVVLGHDRTNDILAVNQLNDSFSASPALADRDLYLRGEKYLYCLSEAPTP